MKRYSFWLVAIASVALFTASFSFGIEPDEYFTKLHLLSPVSDPDSVSGGDQDTIVGTLPDSTRKLFRLLEVATGPEERTHLNIAKEMRITFSEDSFRIESVLDRLTLHRDALASLRFDEEPDSSALPLLDPFATTGPTADLADNIADNIADNEADEAGSRCPEWLHLRGEDGVLRSFLLRETEGIAFAGPAPREKPSCIPSGDPASMIVGVDSLIVMAGPEIARLPICSIDSLFYGTNVPSIHIDIEEGKEVTSKKDWLAATFSLEGFGEYDDFPEKDITIRGRGNSTWGYPKRPYRIKFAKKQSLCGLKKAKNYVLLANFLDGSLMKNAIAFKIAELLEMPYSPHNIPVNLYVNGTYRGAYTLNEKVGINAGSVDIDETQGIMWELDENFDEDFRYRTPVYSLPAMVKDPDITEICGDNPELGEPEEYFLRWQEDLNAMERAVEACDSTLGKYIDLGSLARLALVNNFCANIDFNHPKSIFLYKEHSDSTYKFGPVWDFDWGFTFRGMYSPENLGRADLPLLRPEFATKGIPFWQAIFNNPSFMEEYERVWKDFRDRLFPELMEWLEVYASTIEASADQDARIWNDDSTAPAYDILYTESHREKLEMLREFIRIRMEYMDESGHFGLFEE